ncbi:MAG: HAD-IIA family hydrolase [Acidimicrobiia bacterium]|nr:HAD-IIA family hydrolase [Acidimicrobiia bacterium]
MIGNVVVDIDGVVLLGGEAVPGAGEALHSLARAGYRLVVATNNATRTPQQVADRIEAVSGFAFDPSLVITSTIALAGMLHTGDQPVFPTAEEGMALTLRARGITLTERPEEAATVAVGQNRAFDYDLLAAASTAVLRGARFIASNTDATFPTPNGVAPGAGAIVAAIERVTGMTAEVAGKPHEPMQAAVAACLGPGPVWMVGDRPETDLAFGKAAGWVTVLALSGIVSDPLLVPPEFAPDLVIDSIADLPARLDQAR